MAQEGFDNSHVVAKMTMVNYSDYRSSVLALVADRSQLCCNGVDVAEFPDFLRFCTVLAKMSLLWKFCRKLHKDQIMTHNLLMSGSQIRRARLRHFYLP